MLIHDDFPSNKTGDLFSVTLLKKFGYLLITMETNLAKFSCLLVTLVLIGELKCFQVEKNYLNGKLKAVTAYYVRQDDCKKLKRRPQ